MKPRQLAAAILIATLSGCASVQQESTMTTPTIGTQAGSFGDDLTFMREHTEIILLTSADGKAQVAVAPAYQGRVMTSSASGSGGRSYGYIHRPGIRLGQATPHMTVLGGEDRFWLGPEGGQYALYFAPGAPFDVEHWQVPSAIDWGAWPIVAQTEREVTFEQSMGLTNYTGTQFSLRVARTIRLLDERAIHGALGRAPGPSTRVVAYESDNRITNTGASAWRKDTGLLSIWILGMFRPAPRATVVIPYTAGSEAERGPIVNDAYFGPVSADRLRVGDGALFFRADGKSRGKIGVPRPRAGDVAGSYDPDSHTLTLVQYSLPTAARDYVSSMWEQQAQPYAGDVVNSYNDGPLGPGLPPLGPFYEIESSSPAAELAPGASLAHVHRTVHLEGPEPELDLIARTALGVSLASIAGSLLR